jgi:hypothetical protein
LYGSHPSAKIVDYLNFFGGDSHTGMQVCKEGLPPLSAKAYTTGAPDPYNAVGYLQT